MVRAQLVANDGPGHVVDNQSGLRESVGVSCVSPQDRPNPTWLVPHVRVRVA